MAKTCETLFYCAICLSFCSCEQLIKYTCNPDPPELEFNPGNRIKCKKYFFVEQAFKEEDYCKDFKGRYAQPKTSAMLNFIENEFSNVPTRIGGYKDCPDKIDDHRVYRWNDDVLFDDNLWSRGHPNKFSADKRCLVTMNGAVVDTKCPKNKNENFTACEMCVPQNTLDKELKDCHSFVNNAGSIGACCERTPRACPSVATVFRTSAHTDFCDLLPCSSFRYGSKCEFQCFCKDYAACNLDTGLCPTPECEPGWFGLACNLTACLSPLYYGPDCSIERQCKCKNGQACSPEGRCVLGCEEGLWGKHCDVLKPTDCPVGKCGNNCEKQCGHCKGGEGCTKAHCICPSRCEENWSGLSCNYACPLGKWGDSCEKFCFCRNGTLCDADTGICPDGCAPGWEGDTCNTGCMLRGKWGENCASYCKCGRNVPCNKKTGKCRREFISLKQDCPNNTWGELCELPCKNSLCSVCDRNSRGKKCSQCPDELFWYDGVCLKECPSLRYDKRCSKHCNEDCAGSGKCDSSTGHCLEGCRGFAHGPKCTRVNIARPILAMVIVILAMHMIALVIGEKRRRAAQEAKAELERQKEAAEKKDSAKSDDRKHTGDFADADEHRRSHRYSRLELENDDDEDETEDYDMDDDSYF